MITYIVKVDDNGDKFWYFNGKRHRVDGPAIEQSDGHKHWFLDGLRHREDGPAVEYPNGFKAWYLNDKRHNAHGPAVEREDGTTEYWLDGVQVTESDLYKDSCDGKIVTIEGKEYKLEEVK